MISFKIKKPPDSILFTTKDSLRKCWVGRKIVQILQWKRGTGLNNPQILPKALNESTDMWGMASKVVETAKNRLAKSPNKEKTSLKNEITILLSEKEFDTSKKQLTVFKRYVNQVILEENTEELKRNISEEKENSINHSARRNIQGKIKFFRALIRVKENNLSAIGDELYKLLEHIRSHPIKTREIKSWEAQLKDLLAQTRGNPSQKEIQSIQNSKTTALKEQAIQRIAIRRTKEPYFEDLYKEPTTALLRTELQKMTSQLRAITNTPSNQASRPLTDPQLQEIVKEIKEAQLSTILYKIKREIAYLEHLQKPQEPPKTQPELDIVKNEIRKLKARADDLFSEKPATRKKTKQELETTTAQLTTPKQVPAVTTDASETPRQYSLSPTPLQTDPEEEAKPASITPQNEEPGLSSLAQKILDDREALLKSSFEKYSAAFTLAYETLKKRSN